MPARRKKKVFIKNVRSLPQVFSDFCQNTSAHGFQYWVSTGSLVERLLWIVIVACGFTFASIMVHSAVTHWSNNPSSVAIKTFSKPANELPFPAITICNEHAFDVGQYLRAVFDNFQYSCDKGYNCHRTELLRSHFPGYFGNGPVVDTARVIFWYEMIRDDSKCYNFFLRYGPCCGTLNISHAHQVNEHGKLMRIVLV